MPSEPPSHITSVADEIFGRLVGRAVGWEEVEPVAGVAEQPIFAITEGLLSLIMSQAATHDLSRLRAAAGEADPRALTMLLRLRGSGPASAPRVAPGGGRLMGAHKDVELVESSGPLADLAEVAADQDSILDAAYTGPSVLRARSRTGSRGRIPARHYVAAILPSPDPKQLAICHVNLGVLLSRSARVDEAIEHFDRALELDPTMPTISAPVRTRRKRLQTLGRFGEAAKLHLGNLRRSGGCWHPRRPTGGSAGQPGELRMATGDSDRRCRSSSAQPASSRPMT